MRLPRLSMILPRGRYPRQFWLMFWGMLISTVGSSMVWPFLMIYLSERLGLALAAAASLTTVNAAAGLGAAFIAGPIADRVGRKGILVASLFGLAAVYLLYTQINAFWIAALLMGVSGLFSPMYRVGGDAMMADLIPPEERADAYALLRMSNNVGISVGPAVGGLLAATSYTYAFLAAAVGFAAYGVLLAIFARETLPRGTARHAPEGAAAAPDEARAGRDQAERARADRARVRFPFAIPGYRRVFADRPFMLFILTFTLTQLCATLIWVLLGVHAKSNFGILENQYGLIPMTNALMVVTLQAVVTRRTRRRAPLPVLALGTLFYAAACAGVALSSGFGGFWASMVIMTVGELMLMPTSTTYTANLAPADMRGRYMSIYSLTWNVAYGIGPVTGGFLSDHIGIAAPWWGGALVGLIAVAAYLLLARRGDGGRNASEQDAG